MEKHNIPSKSEPYPFVQVEGDGVHEIAVGPVHAGTIEPGHFRFSVVGEKVLRLEERLGYKHKGIAKRFEANAPERRHIVWRRASQVIQPSPSHGHIARRLEAITERGLSSARSELACPCSGT